MASEAITLLEGRRFSGPETMAETDWLDLGAYKTLSVAFDLLNQGVGSTPKLVIEHAAVARDDQFILLGTVDVALDGTEGMSYKFAGDFLRFVRWKVTGSISSPAAVAAYLVAKD